MNFISYSAATYGLDINNFIAYIFYGIIKDEEDIGKFILFFSDKKVELERSITEMNEIQFYRDKYDLTDNNRLSAGWGNLKNVTAKNDRLCKINTVISDLNQKRNEINKFKQSLVK